MKKKKHYGISDGLEVATSVKGEDQEVLEGG